MKIINKRIMILSIIVGSVFGAIALANSIDRLLVYAQEIEYIGIFSALLERSDIFILSFLHMDFDRYDYMWRRDSSLLLTPIIFYFLGSMVGALPFLAIRKSYHSFVYQRAQNNQHLSRVLLGNIWLPITAFTAFYFLSIITGMLFFTPDVIEPTLSTPIIEIVIFFIMRLLVLVFLVQLLFVVYIKREATIAIISNIVVIILLLIVTIHTQLVNLAIFADFNYLLQGVASWVFINAIMHLFIKIWMKYKLT